MANYDPLSFTRLVDGTGTAANGAKISYFVTGTSTPLAVFSDAGLTTPITQPVVCDSNGIAPAIYLQAKRYKRSVTTSAGVSLTAYSADPIDSSLEMISASAAPSPTFPFLQYWNTSDGHLYQRNSTDTGWTDLGPVDSLLNAATVTQQLAGTATTVASTPDSVAALWQRGTAITTSGGTASLPSTGGGVFDVTGALSAISSAQGGRKVLFKAVGAVTYTHNGTSLILPGGANITTVAGDLFEFTNEAAADASGSNWRCTNFQPSDGRIVVSATQAQQETSTNATFPVTPSVQQYHPSACKCWGKFDFAATINASYNITSLTDTAAGRITVTIATDFSSANYAVATTCEATAAFTSTVTAQAAGTIELKSFDSAGTNTDATKMHFIAFGDQ